MLERLLESRFKPERSVGGTIASVTGHTALVADRDAEPCEDGGAVRDRADTRQSPAQRRCRARVFLDAGSACPDSGSGSDDSIQADRWSATNSYKRKDS